MRLNWLKIYRRMAFVIAVIFLERITSPLVWHMTCMLDRTAFGPFSKISFETLHIILTLFTLATCFVIIKSLVDEHNQTRNSRNTQGNSTARNSTPAIRNRNSLWHIRLTEHCEERECHED